MLKNHLLITLRRLSRKKGYAFLNVFGLALGLAVFGILILFVRYETSYEQFHENVDRIHLVYTEQGPEFQRSSSDRLSIPYGRILEESVPEVERMVRTMGAAFNAVRVDGEIIVPTDLRAFFVDQAVFQIFTFPLVAGDSQSALNNPRTAVIDHGTAIQLFGTDDPNEVMGRTFESNNLLFEITGLMENVPPTTTWRPNVLFSLETHLSNPDSYLNNPTLFAYRTFILYRTSEINPSVLSKALGPLTDELPFVTDPVFHSQPISEIHLHGQQMSSPSPLWQQGGQLQRLRIFGIVGFLILLLAAINYVNLATAYGMQRGREVGVRKTLGATRSQIVGQSLTESVLLATIAGALALVIILFAIPHFNEAVRIELDLGWDPAVVFAFIGMAILVGFFAGAYPALKLSRARPDEAFRTGVAVRKGGAGLRQTLVVFQFSVGIALVITSLVMVRQIGFMQGGSPGIQPDQLIELTLGRGNEVPFAELRNRIYQIPEVDELAAASAIPDGRGVNTVTYTNPRDTTDVSVVEYWMEPNTPQAMGMELVAGSWFQDGDTEPNEYGEPGYIILNEAALRIRGWTPEEAVGRKFPFEEYSEQVIRGVVRDFHYASMRSEIGSIRIYPYEVRGSHPPLVLVRFEPGKDREVMDALHTIWQELAPDLPFQAEFLKDRFEAFYGAERRLAGLFWAFGIIAVIIACLGLFGLAAFTAERRVKEVGIRKVLGADTGSIVRLLSTDFARLVVIAFVIAAPIAWWAMNRWLDDFAYHITLGPGIFLLAGFGALLVALATVSYHAFRAANADPVRSLRSE